MRNEHSPDYNDPKIHLIRRNPLYAAESLMCSRGIIAETWWKKLTLNDKRGRYTGLQDVFRVLAKFVTGNSGFEKSAQSCKITMLK